MVSKTVAGLKRLGWVTAAVLALAVVVLAGIGVAVHFGTATKPTRVVMASSSQSDQPVTQTALRAQLTKMLSSDTGTLGVERKSVSSVTCKETTYATFITLSAKTGPMSPPATPLVAASTPVYVCAILGEINPGQALPHGALMPDGPWQIFVETVGVHPMMVAQIGTTNSNEPVPAWFSSMADQPTLAVPGVVTSK